MKQFLTFALLSIAALAGIKLIYKLFSLGEMEWFIIGIPIVLFYFGSYGYRIPFVKPKDKE
jgi:hypothetical protein